VVQFSPKQKRVLTWWCREAGWDAIICDGAVRSGKTFAMGVSFFLWAQARFDGQQFGLCGKTISSLRRNLLTEVLPKIEGKLKYEIFGGKNGIWGARYEEVLANSKMSLNLNRKEGDKWYSSDRIAHLMGYGILTFQSSKNEMERFFSDRETVYFDGAEDLAEKILYYNVHDEERAAIASAGREKYHRIFSGERVLKFMVETMTDEKYSDSYEWVEEVYR
jgi:hypothetical protein